MGHFSQQSIKGANVVVTGGGGFIGSHLVRRLLEEGARQITVIDSFRYGDPKNLELDISPADRNRISVVKYTLGTDPIPSLDAALKGGEYLFHLAAEKHNQSKDSPDVYLRANIEGTHQLYEAAVRAGIKKIVYTSSLYAYGRVSGAPFTETEVPHPQTMYGISKLAGEYLLDYCQRTHGIEGNSIRYLFIYGPRQYAGMGYKSVIMKNFERLLEGKQPVINGDGRQELDYLYVDDTVSATLMAMTSPVSGELFNVGSGEATSIIKLTDEMLAVSGLDLKPEFGPQDWTHGSSRVGNTSKIHQVLGWKPQVSLRQGLQRTFDWLKSQN